MRTEKVEMRPVLKYPGSKWKMAEWIISLMPPHKSYLEPFLEVEQSFSKRSQAALKPSTIWTARSSTCFDASGKNRRS